MSASIETVRAISAPTTSFYQKLNAVWHKRALQIFMLVVLAHWAEHIAQAYQIYAMGWTTAHAGGMLGLCYPWLVSSELLHYSYALLMLVGIYLLRKGFTGLSHTWWMAALGIQFWHHFEHLLLIGQVIVHRHLLGRPVPTSILQLFFPRVELHLFYNTIVFIPMVIGMYYHMFPARGEASAGCTCALRRRQLADANPA